MANSTYYFDGEEYTTIGLFILRFLSNVVSLPCFLPKFLLCQGISSEEAKKIPQNRSVALNDIWVLEPIASIQIDLEAFPSLNQNSTNELNLDIPQVSWLHSAISSTDQGNLAKILKLKNLQSQAESSAKIHAEKLQGREGQEEAFSDGGVRAELEGWDKVCLKNVEVDIQISHPCVQELVVSLSDLNGLSVRLMGGSGTDSGGLSANRDSTIEAIHFVESNSWCKALNNDTTLKFTMNADIQSSNWLEMIKNQNLAEFEFMKPEESLNKLQAFLQNQHTPFGWRLNIRDRVKNEKVLFDTLTCFKLRGGVYF